MKAMSFMALMWLAVRFTKWVSGFLLTHAFNDTLSGYHCGSLAGGLLTFASNQRLQATC